MFHHLNKEQFLKLAEPDRYVAVYRELLADTITPITAFEALSDKSTRGILLESGLRSQTSGAYSFLGLDPRASFTCKNGCICIAIGSEIEVYEEEQAPLALLRQFHRRFHCVSDPHAKLADQMMGFLSYDAVRYFEEIPDRHPDTANFPDILFHFYQTNLVFNHELNKLLLAVVVEINQSPEVIYVEAQKKLDQIIEKLQQARPSMVMIPSAVDSPSMDSQAFQADCDDTQFHRMVDRVKSYIHSGDVFQTVLSRGFYKPLQVAPLSVYRMLRYSNPTPYMFYLTDPEFVILGASPEKLVSVENREVIIAPIAGTVPLSIDLPEEVLAEALRNDEKECAEHMMLVDLARNDIGVVCEPGSVRVTHLMKNQRLTHVMHLVSYVNGTLAAKYDAFDLLQATFPAGTLSGAPKIRAMEVIDELEVSKRHIYGGAICKIDLEGNMDSCITIRTAVVQNNVICVRAGAGVVFDSTPEKEAAETRHKVKGMVQAIVLAERGIA